MAVRVAELETVFTGDLSDFESKAKTVETRQKSLDGQTATVDVLADAAAALEGIDDVQELLDEIDGSEAQVEVTADTDKMTRDLDDVADQLEDLGDEEVDVPVGADTSSMDDGLRKAEEGLDEFKDEAGGTAREAAASFDGSAESIADVFQELAANAFAGFGPAGAAAGIAVAVGLGAAISAAQELADANIAAKESAADIAVGMTEGVDEASQRFQDWATEVKEDNAWTFWKDEATTNIQDVSDSLDNLGAVGDASLGAIASGSLPEMKSALMDVNAELDTLTTKMRMDQDAADNTMGGGALLELAHNADVAKESLGEFTEADQERMRSLEAARDVLQEQIDAQEDAEEIAVALLVAQEGLTEGEAEYELALRRTNGQLQERADLNQSSLEANLDLADGLAALTEHEEGWKASLNDGTQAGRDNIREIVDLTDDIQALGVATMEQTGSQEQANAAMQAARGDLINTAVAAGYNRSEVEKLIDSVLGIPDDAGTDIYANDHASKTINGVQRELEDIDTYKQIDIRTVFSTTGQPPAGANTVLRPEFSANGNLYEAHDAEIAPGGAWRVWAEPETGGEAYIPLSPAKRPRSMAILEQVAREFGATLTTRANGGVDVPAGVAGAAVASGPRVVQHITVNYPVAEPTSVTTNRALQYAAATGV